jgi:hypothetical protein
MATKMLKLNAPIELHGKTISELVFKEPTGAQYLDLGEPWIIARTKDGSSYGAENDGVIKKYVETCVQGDDGPIVLTLLGFADARRAKGIVLSFFSDADQATSEK